MITSHIFQYVRLFVKAVPTHILRANASALPFHAFTAKSNEFAILVHHSKVKRRCYT